MAQDECCPADDVPGVSDDLLSDFLVGNSLRGVLDDVTRIAEEEADVEALRRRMAALEAWKAEKCLQLSPFGRVLRRP